MPVHNQDPDRGPVSPSSGSVAGGAANPSDSFYIDLVRGGYGRPAGEVFFCACVVGACIVIGAVVMLVAALT